MIFTSHFGTALDVKRRLARQEIMVKAATTGPDLGCDRAAEGTAKRPTRAKIAQNVSKKGSEQLELRGEAKA
eukprot:7807229-Pyramimonas_sp.AAC.1